MKVILNQDVNHLGEEGDIKDVAKGYARNYLFPRKLAVPYNLVNLAHFESRKEEIEAKKAVKRENAGMLKDKLESTAITITMSAGANGKLYGAVTNQTISDELNKIGYEIERKRIEIPGMTIKNIGSYSIIIKLYESLTANLDVTVEAQKEITEKPSSKGQKKTKKQEEQKTNQKNENLEDDTKEIDEQ